MQVETTVQKYIFLLQVLTMTKEENEKLLEVVFCFFFVFK